MTSQVRRVGVDRRRVQDVILVLRGISQVLTASQEHISKNVTTVTKPLQKLTTDLTSQKNQCLENPKLKKAPGILIMNSTILLW